MLLRPGNAGFRTEIESFAEGNVARASARPPLDRRGDHPTLRARRRRFVGRDYMHQPGPVGAPFDTLNPYSGQPQQQCRTVGHGPRLPSLRPIASQQTSEGQGPHYATTRSMRAKS